MESEDRGASVKEGAEEAAARSIEAIEDLIVFTLKDPGIGRFQEAKKLCDVAQSLVKARARRAADFLAAEPPVTNEYEYGGNQYQAAVRAALNQVNTMTVNPIVATTNAATNTILTTYTINTGTGTGNIIYG